MLFSYNWLNDYLTYKIFPEELAELLTMHSFEVESVTKKGEDWILDIDILPNRAPDCFSHAGVAREANALLGFLRRHKEKAGKPAYDEKEIKPFFSSLAPSNDLSISVERSEDSPLYQLMLLRNVSVQKSPEWMRNRLEAVGVRSINNIVDISNYVMLDTGEPLHLFDADEIGRTNGKIHILIRRAKKGEQITLLGGEEVRMSGEDLVITDEKNPLAIAGIKGGEKSGVHEKTKTVLIEAANFNRSLLYDSAKRLGIFTDSAKRWSTGVPLDAAFIALFKAVTRIKELSGGEILGYRSFLPPALPHQLFHARAPIFVSFGRICSLLGREVSQELIRSILFHLGFEVRQESGDTHRVSPPFWRLDCEREEDIAEEVARFVGLNEIEPVFPHVSLAEPLDEKITQWRSFIRNYFVSQGFDETYSYSLVSGKHENTPSLLNPISQDRTHLRGSLMDGLLETISGNQGHHTSLRLFEIGKTFSREKGAVKEREMLAGVLWHRIKGEAFREAKGYLSGFFEAMGFDEDDYDLTVATSYQLPPHQSKLGTGQAATSYPRTRASSVRGRQLPATSLLEVKVNEVGIGFIAIPETPRELKIKGIIAGFEIDLQELIKNVDEEREFEEPPKYPAVERDISLFLEKGVKAGNVMQVIHEVGKELIEDVDLFDMYEEEGKPRKSLAFHVSYRSREKTLRDGEVNAVHKKIEQALRKRFHAQIR